MKVISASELTDAQAAHWSGLQALRADLQSPFLHPDYAREAAAVFPNIEVGVWEQNGAPVAYFPFERGDRNVALPVGRVLCDFQGIVGPRNLDWEPSELLRDCGLTGWRFKQLLAPASLCQQNSWHVEDSHWIDLRGGFEAYQHARKAAGSQYFSRIQRKIKKAVRELGPLRFELQSLDPQTFNTFVAWKSQHYRRISTVNYLKQPGTLEFLVRLWARPTSDLQGLLSTMYLGDKPVATHFGLRCRQTLHSWFPAYDEELSHYSPGMIFMAEFIKAAAAAGIERIDLGRGVERFKLSLRTSGTPVAEGALGTGLLSRSARRIWSNTKHWVQSTPFHVPARAVVRSVRGLFLYGFR